VQRLYSYEVYEVQGMRATTKAGDIFQLFKEDIRIDADCKDCYRLVVNLMWDVIKLKRTDTEKIADEIITLFKECNVLKDDANYKKLYSELVNYIKGLLEK
jgi:hypothetical protein